MRAPSLLKTSRNSGVKNDRPSARGLKSSRMRPFGCKTFCRTSLRKNFQSSGSHSCHSPGPVPQRTVFWKQTRCPVTRSNFPPRSGRGRLRFDAKNHAPHAEQRCRFAKERLLIDVDADAFVTELFADIKKISRTAAEIENAQRRAAIEPEILCAFDVDFEPVIDVGKSIDARRIRSLRITRAQIIPGFAIDPAQDFLLIHRMTPALRMIEKAFDGLGRKELLNFAREIHSLELRGIFAVCHPERSEGPRECPL